MRFPREAKASGADTVIIQHGINDIIHPVGVEVNPFRPWSDLPTAEELIQGLRQYIAQAKEYGLDVYMGTLLPIYGWRTYEPFREELRCAVNEWIRSTKEIQGCIDFDRALCDSLDPRLLQRDMTAATICIRQRQHTSVWRRRCRFVY